MELSDIRDWVKTLGVGDHFYIEKLKVRRSALLGFTSGRYRAGLISLWEVWNAQRQPAGRSVY